MNRILLLLLIMSIFLSCDKDLQEESIIEIPSVLEISSQADIDAFASVICDATELGQVIFNTYDDLDLSSFKNIKKTGAIYFNTCQQIEAFANLEIAGSMLISNLNEDCKNFSLPNIRSIGWPFSVTSNNFLESFSLPELQFVEWLTISENEKLVGVDDISSLLEAERITIDQNQNLEEIFGFQKLNTPRVNSRMQIIFDKYVEMGDAFKELKHIANLNFIAHQGADLDWVSSIESANNLSFTGAIALEELCGLKSLIETNDSISVSLRSWLESPFQLYANDEIIELCD